MIVGMSEEEEAAVKDGLLQFYAGHEVYQHLRIDSDGNQVQFSHSKDLMSLGLFRVRVFVREGEDLGDATRILRSIADTLEANQDLRSDTSDTF